MPSFNYESQSTRLELRVLELEDTVAALINVVSTMHGLVGTLNDIVNSYADQLGGMMLALPSVNRKLPMWPTLAKPVIGCTPQCSCAHNDDPHRDPTP
jgi:hypothetical protein